MNAILCMSESPVTFCQIARVERSAEVSLHTNGRGAATGTNGRGQKFTIENCIAQLSRPNHTNYMCC